MRESAVERKLVTGIRKAGGIAYKFVSPGHAGVPDRLIILPGCQPFFVELKQDTGRLTELQKACHAQLKKLGCTVFTLYGSKDVEGFLHAVQALALPESCGGLDYEPLSQWPIPRVWPW